MNQDYDLYAAIDSFSTRLTMNTMNFLMKKGEMLRFDEGHVIAREGDASDHVYIVIEGEADVRKTDHLGNQVRIAKVGAGHLVGEMGVFMGHKRSATIIARTDMNVVKFDNESFINALPRTPDLTLKLLKSLTEKVNEVNWLVADLAIGNTMLILGIYILEQAQGKDVCEVSIDATTVIKETKLDQKKITAALKSFHKKNMITKLTFSGGNVFVFEAKIPALRTYLKRIAAKS